MVYVIGRCPKGDFHKEYHKGYNICLVNCCMVIHYDSTRVDFKLKLEENSYISNWGTSYPIGGPPSQKTKRVFLGGNKPSTK